MENKIYQVVRNTPYGDCVMGTYSDKIEAEKHNSEWNAKTTFSMDRSEIISFTVKDKYESKNQTVG